MHISNTSLSTAIQARLMAPERLKVPEEADGPNNEARMHENGNLKPANIPIDPQLEHWTGGMPDGSASAEIEAFQQNVGPDNVSTGRSTNPEGTNKSIKPKRKATDSLVEHDPYASRPSVPSAAAAVDLNVSTDSDLFPSTSSGPTGTVARFLPPSTHLLQSTFRRSSPHTIPSIEIPRKWLATSRFDC